MPENNEKEQDRDTDTVEKTISQADMEMSIEELLEYINSLDNAEDYFITVIPAANMEVGEAMDGE